MKTNANKYHARVDITLAIVDKKKKKTLAIRFKLLHPTVVGTDLGFDRMVEDTQIRSSKDEIE